MGKRMNRFRALYPELYGTIPATIMSILHELSTAGPPKGPRGWIAFSLKILIAGAWGWIIGDFLMGTGYEDPRLISSICGFSGWIGTEATIQIVKRRFNL